MRGVYGPAFTVYADTEKMYVNEGIRETTMPVVPVVSVMVDTPVCSAVVLMRYLRMIPLWSSTGGGVHCRATVLESTAKLVVMDGAELGATGTQ